MTFSQPYDQVIIDIKDYIFHHDSFSTRAWENARVALLDSIGCAIETVSKSQDCRRMFGPVVPGSVVPYGFRLPGTSFVLDPLKGAFDMATAIRYLDHNDAIAGADWGHPSGEQVSSVSLSISRKLISKDNLGSILAITDWICQSSAAGVLDFKGPPLTMNTILVALMKAYEIQGCMLLKNAFNSHGLDHVILVKLASVAVVSWLIGLTEDQTMAAISQVWMDGHPLRVYRQKGNTISRKGWAAGDACMKATQLALLTRAGQSGSQTPLTMPRWGFYQVSFGNKAFDLPKRYGSWVIENIIFKVIPVEGHALSSVEASMIHLETLRERKLSAKDSIAKILIRTNAAADMIINKTGPLNNAADRDHCLQYIVALTLLKGARPEASDFLGTSGWATNDDLHRLREKIEISADEQLTEDYMNLEVKSLAAGMIIELDDGTILDEVLIHFPAGHGKNPTTQRLVREKYRRNMSLMFSEDEIDIISCEVLETANGDLPVSDFMALLVREKASEPNL